MTQVRFGAAAMAVMAMLTTGPALAQTFAPPAPQVEYGAPPPPPGSGYVLIPGRWQWNGYRYVWVGRHWVLRPPRYTRWVPGHWHLGAYGRWRWVPGHWA